MDEASHLGSAVMLIELANLCDTLLYLYPSKRKLQLRVILVSLFPGKSLLRHIFSIGSC